MFFGTEIRNATAPETWLSKGIGGNANVIWYSGNDMIYELDPTDFSTIRSSAAPAYGYGIGGDENTIWHSDSTNQDVYELSTTDFSVVRSANAPGNECAGIGGDSNTIWATCDTYDKIYELSTTDFSVIRSGSSGGWGSPACGGNANVIYNTADHDDQAYQIGTSDFIRLKTSPIPDDSQYPSPIGIGGDENTIWYVDDDSEKVYELDPGSAEGLTPRKHAGIKLLGSEHYKNIITFGDDDTSPDVSEGNIFKTATGNSSAINITALDSGTEGQVITIISSNPTNASTIVDGSNLLINGDWSDGAEKTLTLVYDGTNWYEISRR